MIDKVVEMLDLQEIRGDYAEEGNPPVIRFMRKSRTDVSTIGV